MAKTWNEEELEASVIAYMEMRQNDFERKSYSKKAFYRKLARRFGRTEKAYEYRMQNISYVLSAMGRNWVDGLRPAKNVGANVAIKIEGIINRVEGRSATSTSQFQANVTRIRKKKLASPPKGERTPKKSDATFTQYERDPGVVAWVLEAADGRCECCGEPAPFIRHDGTPFLEVHHVRKLADGGSDTISNAIAGCPNCHRELHYGQHSNDLRERLYESIHRLVVE